MSDSTATTSSDATTVTTTSNDVKMFVRGREHVQEPWFTYLSQGTKVVEGRLNHNAFALYDVGDCLAFYKDPENEFYCEIVRKTWYPSIESYLQQEGLAKTLPGIDSILEGVRIYRQFYSAEYEAKFGMLAIEIALIPE